MVIAMCLKFKTKSIDENFGMNKEIDEVRDGEVSDYDDAR